MTAQVPSPSGLGGLIVRQSKAILFITVCLCLAGVYAAWTMPSSVFPQTNFPRVVILVDNGVMPGDQMMATVTRPIEEGMKDIPGVVSVRSSTGRGAAEVNVFFNWSVDMIQSELYVNSRLSQIRSTLPSTASTSVFRLTFSAFPILGVSLKSDANRSLAEMWQTARYTIKPRLLRVPGVARVDLVGGRVPEYHVAVDPLKLEGYKLSLAQVSDALAKGNLIGSAGLHDEEHQLYLTTVDARVKTTAEIADLVVAQSESGPVRVKDFAEVRPGQEPQFNIVTADGGRAVLLNIRSQPEGSTVAIADNLERNLKELESELPPDMHLAFFYDQSLLVRASVGSVWEAILFGLALSVAILFFFLKSGSSLLTTLSTTIIATVVIPVTILVTLVAMRLMGMSFNLMTLGGIAAAIGLVIDDAIVVVESIYTKVVSGRTPVQAIQEAGREITGPLVGSTLTPVVVFLPLAFIEGIQGVFFRSLAVTMVVSLLTSLVLALTLTPTLAAWLMRTPKGASGHAKGETEQGGPILRVVLWLYERAARAALRYAWGTLALSFGVVAAAAGMYFLLKQDFLPDMDEGAFVLDYRMPPGTALSETDRVLNHIEQMLRETPEVESYSRRTGARLALAISEPHMGDFLIKLKDRRSRGVEEVKDELRQKIESSEPVIKVEMAGILGDLIGDLTWSPNPIEIKVFSTDPQVLKKQAMRIADLIERKGDKGVEGVVDVNDGLVYTGSSLTYRVRWDDLPRYGLKADDVARTVNIALLGETPSYVLEGDRQVNIRVLADPKQVSNATAIDSLIVRSESGAGARLSAVADRGVEAGQLELRREDLRQDVAVSARTSGRDLGSVVRDIRATLDRELPDRSNYTLEYGGLYQQQQESFANLAMVLCMAVLLVFLVLLLEFQSFLEPLAIVWGAVLSLFGVVMALWLTGTSLNIISFLGAIIGVGIVAKNGILMLDYVDHLRKQGLPLMEALVQSGRRRLRPVLMTSLAAALGMLPLAYGIGSGAQMLQPLAIAVMGALAISVLLSLLATPAVYLVLVRLFERSALRPQSGEAEKAPANLPLTNGDGSDVKPPHQEATA
ncbi:MAG TPA: acriflavin resistance protein [Planctomycetales bacterium]|jgi:CzcA family heavy metal efflux pump|nr:acriflavin resistance protein [Planctomycetales bacterium]